MINHDSRVAKSSCIWLICICSIIHTTYCQSTTPTPTQSDTTFWPDGWIYAMIGSGFTAALFITAILIHSLYHFTHDRAKVTGSMRYLYLATFVANLLTSIQYATLKTDIIFPVGHEDSFISCKVGYSSGVVGVGISRILLMTLFVKRIDNTFHGSAFAYPPKNLLLFEIFYVTCGLIIGFSMIYFALPVIEYRLTESGIGVCSIFDGTFGTNVTLGSFVVADSVTFLIVAYLFVRKLKQLVSLTSDKPRQHRARSTEPTQSSNEETATVTGRQEDNTSPVSSDEKKKKIGKKISKLDIKTNKHERKRSDSKSGHSSHNDKLKRIMHKQTLLILIAISSSMIIFFAGAIYGAISLLVPVDLLVNTICIWFMFRFADHLWNKIVQCCDCFGCCGDTKDQYIARMNTFSRLSRLSVHNLSPKQGAVKSPITVTNEAGATELYRKPSGHEIIEPQMTDRNDSPPQIQMDPMPVASSTPEISAHNSTDNVSDYEH